MERRIQHLLFETQGLTPGERADTLHRLFCNYAAQEQETHSAQYVPQDVLDAYGELESRLHHLLNAADLAHPDRATASLLRKIEKRLAALPASIMRSLYATPEQDWILCYRNLIELHELLEDAHLLNDAQEYATLVEIMTRLALALSRSAAVKVDAASMFALWLMQAHLRRYSPQRRRTTRKSRRSSAKPRAVKRNASRSAKN